jgi:hypothetical protein
MRDFGIRLIFMVRTALCCRELEAVLSMAGTGARLSLLSHAGSALSFVP